MDAVLAKKVEDCRGVGLMESSSEGRVFVRLMKGLCGILARWVRHQASNINCCARWASNEGKQLP